MCIRDRHITIKEKPKWIYFSSVSEHAIDYHDDVSDWLDEHPEVKLAFQPGTFQMEAGVERLKRIYARTEVLILNREEAVLVSGGDYHDLHDLLNSCLLYTSILNVSEFNCFICSIFASMSYLF